MTLGSKLWANSKRLVTLTFIATICLAITGCGGCGGNSPADKLARFQLNRGGGDEEEEEKKPAPKPKPKAEEKPAPKAEKKPDSKPAEKPKAKPQQTAATPAKAAPAVETKPATAEAPTADMPSAEPPANQIPGARDRFAILEGFRLQPIQGDRSETKARSKAILSLLGQAVAQQIADTNVIPASGPVDSQGRQLLSWRVHLLPYLGYTDLYNKFKLDEPWDSPHNIKLTREKPYAFATPGLSDDRTNFVLVTGPTCAAKDRRPTPVASLTSRSLHNAIVVLEVADPANRVVWTKPQDLSLDPSEPAQGLNGWPEKSFLCVTGDGVVHDVPVISNDHLNRLFVISNPITMDELAANAPATAPRGSTQETSLTKTELPMQAMGRGDFDPSKRPLPMTIDLDSATVELRRLFQNEVREANTDAKKAAIAEKLIQHADYLKDDPTKECAALQIAYRFGVLAKKPVIVKDAFDKLQSKYQVDTFSSDMFTIKFGADNIQHIPAHRLPEFRELAKTILDRAVEQDNFAAIEELIRIGTYYAASQNDQETMAKLSKMKEKLNAARRDYEAIQAKFLSLEVPSLDEQGNLMVGKYWCIHRNNWEKGFTFLMRGNDDRFEYLAETELTEPVDPRVQFKIAEGWWDIGISSGPGAERNQFLERAAQWYKRADGNMDDSIEKVTSQQRLQEFTRLTGIKTIPPL